MPELPEVETIKDELAPGLVGRRVVAASVLDATAIAEPAAPDFCAGLAGRRVVGMERRGKYLLCRLDNGASLIFHMRMTGSLLLLPRGEAPGEGQRVRVVLDLDDGKRLWFVDRRRLGRVWLVNDASRVVGKLGPEPLDTRFTVAGLRKVLSGRRAPVKAVLLDQEAVAGIGNMYADEALFLAGIHPLTPAGSLETAQVKRLHAAIQRVLRAAIASKGASVDTYRRPGGARGSAQHGFHVAHRLGQPCSVCGTPVQRLMLRSRGAYFCPRCQPGLLTSPSQPDPKHETRNPKQI